MTQLKCPECGKEFDDTKQACPNCGCPISLMATQDSSRLLNSQNRMITLAIPIGILLLAMALTDAFDLIRLIRHLVLDIPYPYNSVFTIGTHILTIITFVLLFVWFLSLFKGSVKNSKLRNISVIAIIGIFLYIATSMRVIGAGLIQQVVPSWYIIIIRCGFAAQCIFLGTAFCSLSEFFHRKLKILLLLIGIGFVLKWLIPFIGSIWNVFGYNEHTINRGFVIGEVISILSYLFLSWFFFGFSKTNKS